MMGSATLEPPKTGRSRFSKALPAPPSLPALDLDFESSFTSLFPEDKALPRPQPETPLPPLPPPKEVGVESPTRMATVAKPLSSPLPPLPSKFSGPAPMSIPRRPVAAAPVAPTPALAPTASPGLGSPNPIPSPAGSYSSLLSAYSNHTADSPRSPSQNSSQAIFSSATSYSVVSPTLDTQRSSAQSDAPAREQNAQKEEPNSRRMFEQSNEEPPPPPLPVKDAQREAARPQTPTSVQAQATQSKKSPVAGSPLGNDPSHPSHPSQKEQLWRRRSRSLKSEGPLAVPELKLVSSHGSTAASAQNTAQSGPSSLFPQQPIAHLPGNDPETSEQAVTSRAPLAPPRSANGGLPGRNIRPEPVGEHTTARGDASMGQDTSRIKEKLHVGKTKRESAEGPENKIQEAQVINPAVSDGPTVSPLSAQHLPSPLSDTAISPVPLAVSPELPGEPKPVARKPVGTLEALIRHAKSIPTLATEAKSSGLGVRALAGLPTSPRPDLSSNGASQTQSPAPSERSDQKQSPEQKQYIPYSPAPARSQAPSQTQFPARTSSREDDNQPAQPPTPRQEASPLPALPSFPQRDPEPQNPNAGGLKRAISEAGSVETVKASAATAPRPPPVIREPDHTPSLALDNHNRHPHHPPPPPNNNASDLLPLREPDPNQPDHTDHPGAARFPRNWYHAPPASGDNNNSHNNTPIPDARPLTDRQYRCLTQHRYMTANRQRSNPVACRTCGHKDRNAECYICSSCHLNVCAGCAGLLKPFKGDLRLVLREVREKN